MTSLRRYIFAFFAVCVAFAAGVALADGPLRGASPSDQRVSLTAANARLSNQLHALRHVQSFESALGAVSQPALLHGRLTGTSVGIFVLPGVPGSTVTALSKAVAEAGGEVSVLARVSPSLVDPAKKTYVDSVATNSVRGVPALATAADLPTYSRLGALLARAYTGPRSTLAVDDVATRLDAQLRGAKLVTLAAPLQRRASAVLVLADGQHGSTEAVYAAHHIEAQLVDQLARKADGLLLAAPRSASEPGGLITDVLAGTPLHAVATLNVLGVPSAQVAAVGALAAAVGGQPGSWGMHGDTPAVPPGFASGG